MWLEEASMKARDDTLNDALKDRLSRYRRITLTVTGRKSGRPISFPVWFVLDDGKLYLLPARGSDTQWYKNVLRKPAIEIDARGAKAKLKVVPVTDSRRVKPVIKMFRAKYGAAGIALYSKLDVAVVAQKP
jgi:deazaflavin-dependent oxidoreductase (nitroreductase family)